MRKQKGNERERENDPGGSGRGFQLRRERRGRGRPRAWEEVVDLKPPGDEAVDHREPVRLAGGEELELRGEHRRVVVAAARGRERTHRAYRRQESYLCCVCWRAGWAGAGAGKIKKRGGGRRRRRARAWGRSTRRGGGCPLPRRGSGRWPWARGTGPGGSGPAGRNSRGVSS